MGTHFKAKLAPFGLPERPVAVGAAREKEFVLAVENAAGFLVHLSACPQESGTSGKVGWSGKSESSLGYEGKAVDFVAEFRGEIEESSLAPRLGSRWRLWCACLWPREAYWD